MPKTKSKQRRDIQQEVTDQIVAALEAGCVPWVKPWSTTPLGCGIDRSATSGKPYNGVNLILLWMARDANGWQSTQWITYNAARKAGGNVVKGEKGTGIVLWKPTDKTKNSAGELVKGKGLFVTHYTVFNLDQCENLPAKFTADATITTPDKPAHERLAACEELIAATGARIEHGGDRAFYRVMTDTIRVPELSAFTDAGSYYSTMFHELAHWTADTKRCDRDLRNRFGSEAYAAEELIAEMGSAFLCAEMGIDGKLQHTEYLANWLKVLKSDKRAIFTAASKAKQAVKFIQATHEIAADKAA